MKDTLCSNMNSNTKVGMRDKITPVWAVEFCMACFRLFSLQDFLAIFCRLEKEYSLLKSKENEDQVELRVRT